MASRRKNGKVGLLALIKSNQARIHARYPYACAIIISQFVSNGQRRRTRAA